ncbi:hypothetical protein BDZ89DRAFT_1095211 [Hymenopellis radicata]|nr:hypothetical protein BDZ89DRAFT_1095211 [Hymenopellis radicata]
MTTTRKQAAEAEKEKESAENPAQPESPPAKRKAKASLPKEPKKKAARVKKDEDTSKPDPSHGGTTIERGHIYFFFRPRVEHDKVHSIDDVRNFQMLLLPRPPSFASDKDSGEPKHEETDEMKVLKPGADAVPSRQPLDSTKKQPYRLVIIGKKKLPDPEHGGAGKGRKDTFWATVTKVGEDLSALQQTFGEKTSETKTRGTRHEASARLAGRGGYAIVTNGSSTHFGYHISHPTEMGEVQQDLGIEIASSFVLQVKNPLAPAMAPGQSSARGAQYPESIFKSVFGRGSKGRESYGLRFAPCQTPELLDYEGAQLLLIGARGGEEGLETSLGDHRGEALKENEDEESDESIDDVFRELGLDKEVFASEPIKGEWI